MAARVLGFLLWILPLLCVEESESFILRAEVQATQQPLAKASTRTWSSHPSDEMTKKKQRRKARREEQANLDAASRPSLSPLDRASPRGSASASNETKASSPRRNKGNVPNVEWRAVSWDHLREHPLYVALPEPEVLMPHLESPAQFALFRQDSWHWDALHQGRLTTSSVSGVLGFHEPQSALVISLPRSLTSSGNAASARAKLLDAPPASYVELLKLLSLRVRATSSRSGAREAAKSTVWIEEPPDSKALFPYTYSPPSPPTARRSPYSDSVQGIRMRWGNTQEATSILAAVNFLSRQGAKVCEAGLFPLEASYPTHEALVAAYPALGKLGPLPPMGASPDGVIQWADGTVSAFETKNHAPFRENGDRRQRKPGRPKFVLVDPGPFAEVAAWHVPQLCFHMLCIGPTCRSAIFCSSACSGTVLMRLERDDDFIQMMLSFIARYYARYVINPTAPLPANFFWKNPRERAEYKALLEKAVELGKKAQVVARLPGHQVQRSPHNGDFFLDDKE